MKIDIQNILEKIKTVKIAVFGDLCLDAYWMMDPDGGEVSVETGLKAQAVREQKYTLGGGANIIANLAALNPAEIKAIGAVGDDMFGYEMLRQFKDININTDGIVKNDKQFNTIVFCKRYLNLQEQPRIDFGFLNELSDKTSKQLLSSIEAALMTSDAVILNQQVPGSLDSSNFISNLNVLLEKHDHKIVILDSRDYSNQIHHVILKTNEVESARLNGIDVSTNDSFTAQEIIRFGESLFHKNIKPVFISRGEHGSICVDENGAVEIPGIHIVGQADPVGAGDTMVSALACCLAASFSPEEAGHFANYASVVTAQKRFQTGTASGKEIFELTKNSSFVYNPELAENIQKAHYVNGTKIEICSNEITTGRITHAVFDHDGTISILREGWETVMEPVMVKAILGNKMGAADKKLIENVRRRVLEFIDKTTGIQTILQMEGLVEMVREYNLVPKNEVMDKFGYKKSYNDALIDMVNKRVQKLKNGEVSVADYTVSGAVEFLHVFNKKGVTLYLASGTDQDDVFEEATLLGYANLFNGGIFGSIGDVKKYSKRKVIQTIIKKNDLHGDELVTFGDGPVEMKECRRAQGIAVGIASNENSGVGLNPEKRTRLIHSGAHYVIPDFSQKEALINLLIND